MTDSWATSAGVDLHLDPAAGGVRAGLEAALRDAVRGGRLGAGTRLPSSRALAADLGIARNTVADAYAQLVAEGWLVARRGSGTHVADRAPAAAAAAAAAGVDAAAEPRYDLRPGVPDVSAFPRAAWLAASRRALAGAPPAALGYGDPRGRPELRRALAGYLARVRGVEVPADRVVVCSGFTQALGLLGAVLGARGARSIAVEAYGQPPHRDVLAATGLRLRRIAVDADGADVESAAGAGALMLTPAHQFPLGVALAPRRRTAAVAWATRTGAVVVEDDYDGEFRYDRQPVGAMQALAPDHVVYAGTASKTLAPGLRLSWLVLPADLVDPIAEAKAGAEGETSAIEQLALADLIATGAYDRHVRRARLAYRRRRDRLVAALARTAPAVRVTGIAAGLHALVELPPGTSEQAVVARAAGHGLALQGLAEYAPPGGGPLGPAVIAGYGRPPEHAFTATVARLGAALAE